MNTIRVLLCGLVAAGWVLAATAADQRTLPKKGKPGSGVQRLFGINWQPSLDAATRMAQKSTPGKPVVLLRVLGNLDDKL